MTFRLNTTKFNALAWIVAEDASEASLYIDGVSNYRSLSSVFRDKVSGQIISYDAISTLPFLGGLKTKSGYIHPTGLLSVTARDDDIPFIGIKGFGLEDNTINLLGHNDYSTDWSLWPHFDQLELWSNISQTESPTLGKVFVANPAALTTRLYTENLGDLTDTNHVASVYMQANRAIEVEMYATLNDIESDHQAIVLSPSWKRVQFLLENNESISSGVLSFFIVTPSINVRFMAAKPQLEEGEYASSFCMYEKPKDAMSYGLKYDIEEQGTISFWLKSTKGNENANFFSISEDTNLLSNAIKLDKVAIPAGIRLSQYKDNAPVSVFYPFPHNNVYHHYAITWSEANGIKLFINGDFIVVIPYRIIPLTSIVFDKRGNRLIANLRVDKREVPAAEIAEWAQMDRPFAVPNRVPVS